MIDIFKSVQVYVKPRNYDTTNWAFKLLCHVNVFILWVFVMLMGIEEFFGTAIDCGNDIGSIKKVSIESYCWVMGIYVQTGFTGIVTNKTTNIGYITGPISGDRIYLRYYQWIVCVYLGMIVTFTLPAALWRYLEGRRIKSLCDELDVAVFEKVWTNERRSEILAYFMWPGIHSIHTFYAFKFFVCQVILLAASIFNIWMVENVFSGFWDKYYHAILALYPFDYDTFVEHTAIIFPRMAKCEYYNYGASGSTQKLDALCLLPLNILNEKIFVFLFFWLLLMFVIAALSVIWSLTVASFSCLRILLLKAQSRATPLQQIRQVTNNGSLGDFFVLHLLGKNMNAYMFNDLLCELGNHKSDDAEKDVEKKDIP